MVGRIQRRRLCGQLRGLRAIWRLGTRRFGDSEVRRFGGSEITNTARHSRQKDPSTSKIDVQIARTSCCIMPDEMRRCRHERAAAAPLASQHERGGHSTRILGALPGFQLSKTRLLRARAISWENAFTRKGDRKEATFGARRLGCTPRPRSTDPGHPPSAPGALQLHSIAPRAPTCPGRAGRA